MNESARRVLEAVYFDGVVSTQRPVQLQVADGELVIQGAGVQRALALAQLHWPERTRHGPRLMHLAGGGSLHAVDNGHWDAWCDANGLAQGAVSRLEGSWRWVAASLLALAAFAVVLQQWGIPMLASGVLAATPRSVEVAIGQAALQAMDGDWLQPSKVAVAEQQRLRTAFAKVTAALPPGRTPHWELVFRQGAIGPNAVALPGGTIILTDELVQLFAGDDEVVMGVLAHELGHLQRRHGMRMLVQAGLLGSLSALVLGDFSTMLAGVPVLLGHAAYSREAEHEADREAVRTLFAAGIPPRVMLRFFEKAGSTRSTGKGDQAGKNAAWLDVALASHPVDAERIRFFGNATRDSTGD